MNFRASNFKWVFALLAGVQAQCLEPSARTTAPTWSDFPAQFTRTFESSLDSDSTTFWSEVMSLAQRFGQDGRIEKSLSQFIDGALSTRIALWEGKMELQKDPSLGPITLVLEEERSSNPTRPLTFRVLLQSTLERDHLKGLRVYRERTQVSLLDERSCRELTPGASNHDASTVLLDCVGEVGARPESGLYRLAIQLKSGKSLEENLWITPGDLNGPQDQEISAVENLMLQVRSERLSITTIEVELKRIFSRSLKSTILSAGILSPGAQRPVWSLVLNRPYGSSHTGDRAPAGTIPGAIQLPEQYDLSLSYMIGRPMGRIWIFRASRFQSSVRSTQ